MATKMTLLLAAAGLTLPLATASAQTPAGLEDLVGARAAGAENALQSRGYIFVRTQTGDDRKWSYWWNERDQRCLSVVVMNGRYDSIIATPAPDCGKAGVESREHHASHGGPTYSGKDSSAGYHPDLGYRPAQAPREGGSYADDMRRPAEVDGVTVALGLVCFGDGQRPGVATNYGWSWNSHTDRYDYGSRTEMTTSQFDASLTIQLWDGGGRIRLPRKLIPPINSRSDNGWWALDQVTAGPDRITAQYRLNGLNKPRVTIDRRSGRITIVGTAPYGFQGNCDTVEDAQRRKF